MSLFGNRPRSAQQKAQWAKTRLVLRGAALAYLVVFIIIPMINPKPEDIDAMNPIVRYAIIAFFIIACGGLIIVTIRDYFRSQKNGLFSPEAYEDDEVDDVGESTDSSDDEDESEDYDDDDEDDEDYDDDDDVDYEEEEDEE